jgi:hypothetical protein
MTSGPPRNARSFFPPPPLVSLSVSQREREREKRRGPPLSRFEQWSRSIDVRLRRRRRSFVTRFLFPALEFPSHTRQQVAAAAAVVTM